MPLASEIRILVVDDHPGIVRDHTSMMQDEGYQVMGAASAEEARDLIEQNYFDLLVLDEKMGGMSGTDLLIECAEKYPGIGAVFVTGWYDLKSAVRALQAGALDFLEKPVPRKQLLEAVKRALAKSLASRAARQAQFKQRSKVSSPPIGRSQAWQQTLKLIDRVKDTMIPVLLLGETGTGKEVVARAIHESGERAAGPFVAVELNAISSLAESNLFGYKKGAFTGAVDDRPGLFEAADGGTIVIDEVGDLAADLQVKLLRVLEDKKFRRLGDTVEIPMRARLICATNKDLKAEIKAGKFREDLYFRISTFPIHLPALRYRREDISVLAAHLLTRNQLEMKVAVDRISDEATEKLARYDWPGNVRELNNVIQRAMILANGNSIEADDLLLDRAPAQAPLSLDSWCELTWDDAKAEFAKTYFTALLKRAKGSKNGAAKLAKMNRSSLWEQLTKYEIDAPWE